MNTNSLKNILAIATLLISSLSLQAQDLIITNEGDSINCKITKVTSRNVYFTFIHNSEVRETLLPLDKVKLQHPNYYKHSVLPPEKLKIKDYPSLRLAVSGGWSYRFGQIPRNLPREMKDYLNELKSGYNYGLDLSYYFTEYMGIGFKYSVYKSKHDALITLYETGSPVTTKTSDDISINFIGPFFTARFLNQSKKNAFIASSGIGYSQYINNGFYLEPMSIKGSTIGFSADFGYDFGITERFAIGIQVSVLTGILTQYELSQGKVTETVKLEIGNYETLNRVFISAGLRFLD